MCRVAKTAPGAKIENQKESEMTTENTSAKKMGRKSGKEKELTFLTRMHGGRANGRALRIEAGNTVESGRCTTQ